MQSATDGSLNFYDLTGSSEAMRIDSSGNLLVGTTNGNPTGNHEPGCLIFNEGQINVHRDGGNPLRVGSSVDGNLTEYYKQGALVGSIGTGSGTVYFANSTTGGIRLGTTSGATLILPCNESGATEDAAHDLGYSSIRWRDLYLSGRLTNDGTGGVAVDSGGDVEIIQEGTGRLKAVGGIFIGGTASGNHLDDYEEGSWLPSLGAASVNPTVGYNAQVGHYTKIGNLVTVSCRIVTNSRSGGSGHLIVRGLPFTVAAAEAYASATIGFNYNWNTPPQHAGAQANTVTVLLYQDGRTNAVSGSGDIAASGSSYLNLSCSYITNS